jgi:hypothetical protein
MSLRRGLYVAKRTFSPFRVSTSVPLGRFYATTTQTRNTGSPQQNTGFGGQSIQESAKPQHKFTQEERSRGGQNSHRNAETNEFLAGDFVGYSLGDRKAHGHVRETHTKPYTDANTGVTHQASEDNPLVKIEDFLTKNVSYHFKNSLQWLARKMEEIAGEQVQPATAQASKAQTTSQATPGATTASNQYKNAQRLANSAEKLDKELNAETSPLHINYTPGDIVRFRQGRNYTAGVVLDIVFKPVHDESANFHNASKENPMARIENLWTKKITYHHLNVLEPVKGKREMEQEHGRYAADEFGVYKNKA